MVSKQGAAAPTVQALRTILWTFMLTVYLAKAAADNSGQSAVKAGKGDKKPAADISARQKSLAFKLITVLIDQGDEEFCFWDKFFDTGFHLLSFQSVSSDMEPHMFKLMLYINGGTVLNETPLGRSGKLFVPPDIMGEKTLCIRNYGNRNQEKLVQLFLEVDPHESFFDDGGPSTVDVEDESWDQIQRVKNVARSMCEAAKLIKVLQSLTSIKSDYFRMKYMQNFIDKRSILHACTVVLTCLGQVYLLRRMFGTSGDHKRTRV